MSKPAPAVSHCSICQHVQPITDHRRHNCAQVLRAQVVELRAQLAQKDSDLVRSQALVKVMHMILSPDAATPGLAALSVRNYANRLADMVTAAHQRATRTTAALAIRLVRNGRSKPEIERSIAQLAMDNP